MSAATNTTIETPSSWERPLLASGVVAAALAIAAAAVFIAFVVPHLPPLDAPAAERAAFYAEQSQSTLYRLVSYLGEAQMAFLLLFFAGLLGVLRRAEGGSGSLATAVFAAGIAVSVISPIAIMVEDHLLLSSAAAGVDPVIVSNLDGFGPLSFALGGFPQAVVLVGTAAIVLSRRLAPRWIGFTAYGLAALSLIGTITLMSAAMFPLAALAMLLFRVWIFALSLALLGSTQTKSQPVTQHLPA